MPDLTPALLPQLREQSLPGLSLGGDFVYPAYQGQSILNIPASLCRLLEAPEIAGSPLLPEILTPLGDSVRRIILIVMDALALHRLQRWMANGSAPVWNWFVQDGLLAPLTSIVPSTTSAALSSLWTGVSANQHGISGYEMWMKEYGLVANTITQAPMAFRHAPGSLEMAGFKPENFLPFPTLGSHLAAHGIRSYAFQHQSILNSKLSQGFFKDVDLQAFHSSADLWVNARRLLESKPAERMFVYVYWSEVDTLSHLYGPDDERTAAEFAGFSLAFERLFLEKLSPAARQDTLLLLIADHGQISTHPDPHYALRNHPSLARRLHILPTGENRLAFLYIRPGQTEAVREVLERTWPNQFDVVESAYALSCGLFGPGEPHPLLLDRIGDMIVIARDNAYLWWPPKEDHLFGRHGGLHQEEMLVPFLAARL